MLWEVRWGRARSPETFFWPLGDVLLFWFHEFDTAFEMHSMPMIISLHCRRPWRGPIPFWKAFLSFTCPAHPVWRNLMEILELLANSLSPGAWDVSLSQVFADNLFLLLRFLDHITRQNASRKLAAMLRANYVSPSIRAKMLWSTLDTVIIFIPDFLSLLTKLHLRCSVLEPFANIYVEKFVYRYEHLADVSVYNIISRVAEFRDIFLSLLLYFFVDG